MQKTNAMRALDAQDITYEVLQYSDEIHSAEGVAEALGLTLAQVFKTLVVMREKGRPILVAIPGGTELDLKALARASGEKKLRMASYREAEALTGLQVGGISALALLPKGFAVYADESVWLWPRIFVSAGRRGTNLAIAPADFVAITGAKSAPVARLDKPGP